MAGLTSPASIRKSFILPALIIGFSGMIGQIVLLRELLVNFLGNEMSIGIILANWLLLEAFGSFFLGKTIEHVRCKISLFIILTLLFSIFLPGSFYFARIVKDLFNRNVGEVLGVPEMVFFSLLVLAPVSVTHGALFIFAAKIQEKLKGAPEQSAGKIYMYEVLGTAGGGIVFTYVMLPSLQSIQIVFIVSIINVLVCAFLLLWFKEKRTRVLGILTLILLVGGLYLGIGGKLGNINRISIQKQWGDLDVLVYQNSPYGNITVTKREEQFDFFSDGIPIVTLPTPDIAAIEDFVHIPLFYHKRPEDILVISGGAGGVIQEIKKHNVRSIDYVEIDPLLIRTLKRFYAEYSKSEWLSSEVTTHNIDGRRFLHQKKDRYDCIFIGLSEPNDLQVNRFFTVEFFELAAESLRNDGLLTFTLPGSLTHLPVELKNLIVCLQNTARQSFRFVFIIPGETNIVLCSNSIPFSDFTSGKIKRILEQQNIDTKVVTPFYIDYRYQKRKFDWFASSLKNTRAKLNRDFHPMGVFYALNFWNAKFSPAINRLMKNIENIGLVHVLGLCCVLFLAFYPFKTKGTGNPISKPVLFSILTTGLSGMLFDLMIVFAFQVVYGYVYYRIGMLITAFMAGTGLGSLFMTRKLSSIDNGLKAFMFLEIAILIYAFSLPLVFIDLFNMLDSLPRGLFIEIPFYIVSVIGGILIGLEFPLAVKMYHFEDHHFSRTVGALNSADLIGGWIGGIAGGVVLLPLFGFEKTSYTILLLKGAAILLLIVKVLRNNR